MTAKELIEQSLRLIIVQPPQASKQTMAGCLAALNVLFDAWSAHGILPQAAPPITDPDLEFYMPPGYATAVIYNLAVDLAPLFGRQMDPRVTQLASENRWRLREMVARIRNADAGVSKAIFDPWDGRGTKADLALKAELLAILAEAGAYWVKQREIFRLAA